MWHRFYKFSKGKPGHENMYESPFNLHSQLMLCFLPPGPKFQPRANVVSELKFNIKITLIRHWKWNKIWRRIFNFANVDTTSKQRFCNFVSTSFQHRVNVVKAKSKPIGLLISIDLSIVNIFFLLYEKTIFAIY